MRAKFLASLLAMLTLVLAGNCVRADVTVDDIKPGAHVHGDQVEMSALHGKIVLVAFWGTKCGPCLAEIPSISRFYNKYKSDGFQVVACEAQNSDADAIDKVMQSKGAKYPVFKSGSINGLPPFSGIPHLVLFGPDGVMVKDNISISEVEKQIKTLTPKVWSPLAGPGPYVKLATQAQQIKAGVALGALLKTLDTKQNSKDPVEAAEAKTMFTTLREGSRGLLTKTLAMKTSNPPECVTELDKLATQYAGDEVGTTAKTESDSMKKDPAVKKELEAEAMFKRVASMVEQLKPAGAITDPKDEKFKKLNANAIQGILAGCASIKQRYAETGAAAKATALEGDYK